MIADGSWKKALDIDGRPVRLQDPRAADRQLIAWSLAGMPTGSGSQVAAPPFPADNVIAQCGRRGRKPGAR